MGFRDLLSREVLFFAHHTSTSYHSTLHFARGASIDIYVAETNSVLAALYGFVGTPGKPQEPESRGAKL